MPPQLPRMILAEIRSVFSRNSGRAALVIAALIGIIAVGALHQAGQVADEVKANGVPAASMLKVSLTGALGWALQFRNFFVLPLLLSLSAAASLSGELAGNTFRELLVRPVPRWSVIAAKLAALMVLSAGSLVLTFSTALVSGAALFGMSDGVTDALLGYAATWACDLGLVCMTLLLASFLRSVGGVVVALALYLMADRMAGMGLGLLGSLGVDWASAVRPYLPGNALSFWGDWDGVYDEGKAIGLAGLVVVCLAGTLLRVQRMDVP